MQILYRLEQDWNGMLKGWCIMEGKYKGIYYLDKPLFSLLTEEDIDIMISYDDKNYCIEKNIESVLFYTEEELKIFKNKIGK
jgi:hypothetical protein